MTNDSDFFGDVFEDPEDDPLLGGDSSSSEQASPQEPEEEGPPSWMSEEQRTNGEAASSDVDDTRPGQKQIVVDQRGGGGEGIDELNRAVGQGWRLVRISLARPDGEQAATAQEAHRFVAVLEQDSPQSLFDFGATS
jgi:hypothetical protein